LTTTRPVIAQTTTVSQKVPVEETSLPDGVLRHRRRRDDRGAAETRLVREEAARDAEPDRLLHPGPEEAAEGGLARERGREDEPEGGREVLGVRDEEPGAAEDVEGRHEGDEELADPGDRLDAAEDDDGGQDRHEPAADPRRDAERLLCEAGDGIRLDRAPDAKGGDGGERGEDDAEPLRVHPPLEDVHRAAGHRPVRVLHPEADGEERLGVLRRDAEDAGQPHPEDGARPAGRDRRRDADDVPGPDRRGEGGRQGAELADVAGPLLLPAEGDLDGRPEVPLGEAEAERQEEVRSEEKDDEGPAPDEVAAPGQKLLDGRHAVLLTKKEAGKKLPEIRPAG
jgi:hypothetical protein